MARKASALDELTADVEGKPTPKKVAKKKVTKKVEPPPVAPSSDPPTSVFESAAKGRTSGKFAATPDIGRGFNEIIVDLFATGYDVNKEYAEIVEALRIKGAVTPGAVKESVNNVEEMARRAYRLFIVANVEVERYVHDTDSIVGAMRDRANAELEVEKRTMVKDSSGKEKPLRSKQITDADVVAMSAQMFPDEWAEVSARREQAVAMRKYMENLAELAKSRCFTVRKLAPNGEA